MRKWNRRAGFLIVFALCVVPLMVMAGNKVTRTFLGQPIYEESHPTKAVISPGTYSYGDPTAAEQAHLERINRARLNPQAEADRLLGGNLNEGPPYTPISTTAKQPLTFNAQLYSAAKAHSQDMLVNNYFSHYYPDGCDPNTTGSCTSTPATRIGYPSPWYTYAENIALAVASPGPINQLSTILGMHDDFVKDFSISTRGHRVNIFLDGMKEIGIGSATGPTTYGGTAWPAGLALTCDFGAYTGRNSFVLGVVYNDSGSNGYDAGEGISGATISVLRDNGDTASTTTASAGGYGIPLPNGSYTITARLADNRELTYSFTLSGQNVKVDFEQDAFSGSTTTTTTTTTSTTTTSTTTTTSNSTSSSSTSSTSSSSTSSTSKTTTTTSATTTTTLADSTPNPFTFTDLTNVPLNTAVTSAITVSGINTAAIISISGGTYSINGVAHGSDSAIVNNGSIVTVQVMSSGNYFTKTEATVTIGGVSDTFSVTTLPSPGVTPPDQFTFADQTGVALNTLVTSNAITVSGITMGVPISITGGTYSINDESYTNAEGIVYSGDSVTVQQTSSDSYSAQTDATLNIGGVTDTFSVTTKAEPAGNGGSGGGGGGGGGCFIATAAFGSPLAGQVEILRQFRDRYLMTNAPGRQFVDWYYRNGPVAANYISDKPWAKTAVRAALYPLIGFSALLIYGYLPSVMFVLFLSALFYLRLRPKKEASTFK